MGEASGQFREIRQTREGKSRQIPLVGGPWRGHVHRGRKTTEGVGGGGRCQRLMWTEGQLGKRWKVLEKERVMACTTARIYVTPLSCALEAVQVVKLTCLLPQ